MPGDLSQQVKALGSNPTHSIPPKPLLPLHAFMICPGTKFSFTFFYLLYRNLPERGGPDSVAGTATRYELDGPEIESLFWRDFPYSTKSAPRPTQRPCKMRTGSVSGVKKTGLGDDHPTHHSAEVANGLGLYIRRLSVLALACHGVTFV